MMLLGEGAFGGTANQRGTPRQGDRNLLTWLESAGILEGAVFRPVNKGGEGFPSSLPRTIPCRMTGGPDSNRDTHLRACRCQAIVRSWPGKSGFGPGYPGTNPAGRGMFRDNRERPGTVRICLTCRGSLVQVQYRPPL